MRDDRPLPVHVAANGGVMSDVGGRGQDAHAVLAWRLDRLEKQVDQGFKSVNQTIIDTSLAYVRLDLYLSERDAQRADIEAVRKLAMWAVGLVCSTALGAVLLGIIAMSGAFQ